jgi:hypothetical protein
LARVVLSEQSREDPAMLEGTLETIEATLPELLAAIREVANDDDEAFAVLEWMLDGGRIAVVALQPACAA